MGFYYHLHLKGFAQTYIWAFENVDANSDQELFIFAFLKSSFFPIFAAILSVSEQ
ncbi:hypothetical protein L211DRAFT_841712 [Terfezia boudieri ATCC MYA-4762]|uniref:Uncharacterized protein n=1 Tax=Terfezia boudieri ATCC MYA-4762 TaxID=1051890 RepID=A0A3N4LCS6_9PEZI|nr:hypothetical protein L211DRAFT_841712 [Terfezia boudieri ATCC MYA-4762]